MRIIEGEYDDRPLQGPWSRRRESRPLPGGDVPSPREEGMYRSEGDYDDRPLQGPWSRRQDPAPSPVGDDPEEIWAEPEEEKEYTAGSPDKKIDAAPERTAEIAKAAIAAVPEEEKPAPVEQCRPRGREIACMHSLFRPSGIYAGIVMAEILGGRGGRSRRR